MTSTRAAMIREKRFGIISLHQPEKKSKKANSPDDARFRISPTLSDDLSLFFLHRFQEERALGERRSVWARWFSRN